MSNASVNFYRLCHMNFALDIMRIKNETKNMKLIRLNYWFYRKCCQLTTKITSEYSQFDLHKFGRKLQKVSKIPPTFLFPWYICRHILPKLKRSILKLKKSRCITTTLTWPKDSEKKLHMGSALTVLCKICDGMVISLIFSILS